MIGPFTVHMLERQNALAKLHAKRALAFGFGKLDPRAAEASREEGDCLWVINETLRNEGYEVGDTVQIGKDLFRVCNFGCMAVRVQPEPPQDEDEQQAQRMTDWQELASNWSPP